MTYGRIGRLVAIALVLLIPSSSDIVAQTVSLGIEAEPPLRVKGTAQAAVVGLTPSQIRRAYGFDQITNQGAGQTIAIIEAYGHPHIEDDLAVFSQTFNLPPCTTDNGCFKKISSGQNAGAKQIWSLETAVDVEWAHAIAPQAQILLIEAKSDKLSVLLEAVDLGVQQGASVISMSWGAPEFSGEDQLDSHFLATNATFVAGSGDFGPLTLYPSASPFVTAVGGTSLSVDTQGNYIGETAWSGSGGGLSGVEIEPAYQASFNIPNNPDGKRGIPDVAYDGDTETGFAVYTSQPFQGSKGWIQIAGTSAGTPQWAALAAIVNSIRLATGKHLMTGMNTALYDAAKTSYSTNYHDITTGSNGTCGVLCNAATSYDYVTGLGSPRANNLINTLASAP